MDFDVENQSTEGRFSTYHCDLTL